MDYRTRCSVKTEGLRKLLHVCVGSQEAFEEIFQRLGSAVTWSNAS